MADGSGLRAIHTTLVSIINSRLSSGLTATNKTRGCSFNVGIAEIKIVQEHIKYPICSTLVINRKLVICRKELAEYYFQGNFREFNFSALL